MPTARAVAARPPRRPTSTRLSAAVVAAATAAALIGAGPQARATTAPDGPGANASWNETDGTQGFATALSSTSKVWYTLGNGALENVFYPQTDQPDTYGLQYYVTDGSTFTDSETANTTHAVSLADPTSLTWTQTNTATNGDFTITKTYVADPARSVVLVQTTFDNLTSTPLYLYADYQPYLANDGMGNSGDTDSASGDLVAVNGSVASAMTASTGFAQTSTGYVGTASSGATELASSHSLPTTYSATTGSGHIDQVGQVPVAAGGSTSFTLALAFDTSESAAVTYASASLTTGFASAESSYEAGWHTWLAGLDAPPASVTGSSALKTQYYVALMEVKADEDKTYVGAFVAAPNDPWGSTVSANSSGDHGYHVVWTRDEYEMATALLADGDTTDANAALQYMFQYEEESSGQVKQNTWLNGNAVFGSNQEDEEADPIVLAYQLGATNSTDFGYVKLLANYIANNGPYTSQERWEEQSGYSPATIAAEIAGLICAASIATTNGDTSDASAWLSKAVTWQGDLDGWTYTTTGPYGSGYYVRITPDGNANSGASIGLANGGGSHDDRTVVDQSFLELVRLGVKAYNAPEITNTLAVTTAQLGVSTPEGVIDHRYNFDGYGETSSGADYTGSGVGNPWPVLTGELGEYDVADQNPTGAEAALKTMAGAAANDQISEQVWAGSTGTGGFTFGQPDNSSTPLMWAMAQYVRLALDISAGQVLEMPSAVCKQFNDCPPAAVTTAPAVPGTPTATAKTDKSVSLSWTASAVSGSNAPQGYDVYRAAGAGSTGATLVGQTTGTTYTDTGLTASTEYTYYIVAYNIAGSSGNSGTLTVTTDVAGTPPNAPTGLTVTGTTATTASLSWTAATDTSGTVAGYQVYRATSSSGAGTLVGQPTGTTFTDTGLTSATAYWYYVEAVDTTGDVSAASGRATATTTAGGVTETVDLTVPVNTVAAGQTVYLNGNLSVLGNGQSDWAVGGVPMTEIDPTYYTATIQATAATTLSYKYTLGASWNNVEETGSCGYVANRSMSVNGGTVNDIVYDWAGPNTCGNAQAVIDVTVPSSTPSGDTVYLSGAFSALGIGMSSANDWGAALYPMTRIGTDEWQMYVPAVAGSTLAYKFDLNGTWSDVEETGSCGYVNNRSFAFNGADSSSTANDTVAAWDTLGGC
jgi:glucoamylase